MLKVLLAGGGTAGHINPALAIADIIKKHRPDAEFLFAGTPEGMESKLIPKAGYNFAPIKVAGFQRKLSLKNIKRNVVAVNYLVKSGSRAKKIIKDFSPDIAIGTGGYVAGPIIRMAAKLGIPTAIHEQNAYPGVTNKILAKKVDFVMLTVKDALDYFDMKCPFKVTGLPVRKNLLNYDKESARKKLGIDDSMCILSFGGSLGAGCINSSMQSVIKWEIDNGLNINHIHGYGKNGRDIFPDFIDNNNIKGNKRVRISEYIDDMDIALAAADLVVCRSGASTLAELEAVGRASILIPSPIVAGNHQYYNAMVLKKAGAAVLVEQKDVTDEKIIEIINDFYKNPKKLEKMSKNASNLAISDTEEEIWNVLNKLIQVK